MALLNNAIAFRYRSVLGNNFHVNSEKSTLIIPESDAVVWYFERKNNYKLKSYAGLWEHCLINELPTISGKNPIQGAPLLFQYPTGKIAVLTEVNLQNYSGARWDCSISRQFTVDFTEGDKGFFLNSPLCTPWRVLFVVNNLTELVNQRVIEQLSPKPDRKLYSDRNYIVPGKSVWRWFSKGTGNPTEEREYIDYAAKLNFKYSTIDEGWELWPNYWSEIKKLTAYGRTRNVSLFLWKHSHTISDSTNNYEKMRLWLDKVIQTGVAGVKVDFMDSESKEWIDFDIKLLTECAKRKLLVNFHGCQKPSGEQYTYPNEITREGIRGLELNKHPEGSIPSYHNALLPFTRYVLGHGDYTPLSFVNPGNTTFAHQLATLVAFDSPLQVVAEDPEILLNNPLVNQAIDFIKAVPCVWDKTIVLPQTELGKTAVVARRKGLDWFIYLLNGTSDTINKTIDLSQFDSSKKTVLYIDDLKAKKIRIEGNNHHSSPYTKDTVVPFCKIIKSFSKSENIILAPNGGAVLWVTR